MKPYTIVHCRLATVLLGVLLMVLLSGCGERGSSDGASDDGSPATLTVWAHHGKPDEWRTIQEQVERFNQSGAGVRVKLIEIAEADYDTQVQSAAASGELPDVLEFDGPLLANYAWKGYLKPLGDRLSPTLREDLLPSILDQGTYADQLFAVGVFDSGLGLFANRKQLQEVNARIPNGIEDAWTIAEFNELLEKLARQKQAADGNRQVLDLKRDYRGEWWIYGFYPTLNSAGTDLIDRDDHQSADGQLNSPEAVATLTHFQNWVQSGWVDPNTDGRAFVDGRAAVSWVGHWEYPRYREALGEDLLALPLPDFGQGSRTAMGSWVWGITRNCDNPDAAMQFIEFLLQPDEILAMIAANGAVPARKSAIARSELYQQTGPLHLFAQQLETIAVPRPRTPAYPVISSAFQKAMLNIMQGASVKTELDRAVQVIDQDIRDNEGYPIQP